MNPFDIVAPSSSADGYGYSAECLILSAVRDHGADIRFIRHDWRDERYTDPELLEMAVEEYAIGERDVVVTYFLPFALTRFRSRTTIGMSMWETDRIPDSWAACGPLADGFIVPSQHSKDVFNARMDCPIEVVPFGVDTDLYSYHDRQGFPTCIFLMAGLLHYRKGLEFALRAFREEFHEQEDARLWLKTRKGFLDAGSELGTLNDPRVTILDADYTRQEMTLLYHSVDCLLAPSRGEGSGLTPREAMSTGLPVIMTNWSGMIEIADPHYGYPISVEDLEPAPYECSSYQHGITGGSNIGNFARPSITELRAAMRSVYENREEARRRGYEASEWMRSDWTWKICSRKWLAALEKLTMKYVTL